MHGYRGTTQKTLFNILVAAAAIGLAGCQTTSPAHKATNDAQMTKEVQVLDIDPIGEALISTAESSSRALDRFAMVQQTRTPPTEVKPASIPAEMQREIILEWHGKIEPALSALSREIGYTFEVSGRPGTVPVLVHLDGEKPRSIYAILQDLGLQAGNWATVAVNPDDGIKRVELRYASN